MPISPPMRPVTAGSRSPRRRDRIVGVLPLFHVFAMTAVMNFGIVNGSRYPAAAIRADAASEPDQQCARHRARRADPVQRHARHAAYRAISTSPRSILHLRRRAPAARGEARVSRPLTGAHSVEGYGLCETSPCRLQPIRAPARTARSACRCPAPPIEIRSTRRPDQSGRAGRDRRGLHPRTPGHDRLLEQAASHRGCCRGALRTGDVGYIDEDGYIFIVDRIKDMIIASRLQGLSAADRGCALPHPSVAEVVVVGIPDPYRGQAPKAFVKLRKGGRRRRRRSSAFPQGEALQARVPRDRVPRRPAENAVGKLSKRELRAEAKR